MEIRVQAMQRENSVCRRSMVTVKKLGGLQDKPSGMWTRSDNMNSDIAPQRAD